MDTIHKMKYNSQTDNLRIPEYGRHVQNLIRYIATIEDEEKRQAYADYMINLMYFINKDNNNSSDKKDKLWKHAVIISNYELDVKMPDGAPISKEDTKINPKPLAYPETGARYRHYGHYVQELIKKAIAIEDEEEKQEFAQIIGSYMKLAYLTWNRNHYVNDDSIKEDLKILSKGKLVLDDKTSLDHLSKSQRNQRSSQKRSQRRSSRGRKRN